MVMGEAQLLVYQFTQALGLIREGWCSRQKERQDGAPDLLHGRFCESSLTLPK